MIHLVHQEGSSDHRGINIIAKISVINIDIIFAHAHKITGACGWQKLFRAGQILYSQTNFLCDFWQVSILGFPLKFDSKGTVIQATFFFNLSHNIVVLQVETCCAYYHACDQLVSQQNTVLQVEATCCAK